MSQNSNYNTKNTSDLINEPVFENANYRKILYFFFKNHKLGVSYLLLLMLIGGITNSIDSILIKKVIDFVDTKFDVKPTHWLDWNLMIWPLIFFGWWEFLNLLWRAYDIVYLKVIPKIKQEIIEKLFSDIQTYPYQYFKNQDSSLIPGRIMEAARSLEMTYAIFTEQILRKIVSIITALFVIYYIDINLFLIFFAWIVIFTLISFSISAKAENYSKTYSKSKVKINGLLSNSLLNIFNVKIFNGRAKEIAFLSKYTDKMREKDEVMQIFMTKVRYLLGISCSIMVLFIIYFTIKLKSENILSLGDVALVINMCIFVANDVWELVQEMSDYSEELGAFKQSCNVIRSQIEFEQFQYPNLSKKSKNFILTKGSIEFKNISFGYVDQQKLFIDESILINGGEKIALVGSSGSGKSTFANLIARVFDIQMGSILIDNQSIYDISIEDLNKNISFIAQEPILFERTIFDNIAYGVLTPTLEEVITASKKAFIHEKIMSLKENYYSKFGEKDINFSIGEKQRVIIARAILKNAPILILDEATSALDNITEKLITNSLDELMKNKTSIIIAHRLYTLTKVDKILVFEGGKIVESGKHEDLLSRRGQYYKLWQSQFEIK